MPPRSLRSRRRSLTAFFAALVTLSSPAKTLAWPDHSYAIEVELDPVAHVVRGTERVRFRNTSARPLTDLYLHLYLNAFADDRTVFMRESRGALRGLSASGRGSIEVRSLRTAEGFDLLPGAEHELIPFDRTQMRVPLPAPLAPNAEMELEIEFKSRLPPLFARSGHAESFHAVAQFFPKLAKLESDGRWASFPYHGYGEFYADFADYELTVRAPPDFVIGATGTRVGSEHGESFTTHRFEAPRVHDVAFVAWPHFEEETTHFRGVDVHLLAPPGHGAIVRHHRRIVREGLTRFGALFGAYPYRTLTVVVPPRIAEGAAAMEYPTLFFTSVGWLPTPGISIGRQSEVTAHELAHQWFQGIIATDEVTWPMLDEGLATWAASDLLRSMYGAKGSAIRGFGLAIDVFELLRAFGVRGGREPIVPGLAVHRFTSARQYARAVYARPALVLETVRRTYGAHRFERALGTYARRGWFRHPTPEELFEAFDEEYGAGFSDRTLRPALLRGARGSVHIAAVRTTNADSRWVEARRDGEVAWPTTLVTRGDGRLERAHPFSAGKKELVLPLEPSTRSVILDPENALLLDDSVLDQRRRATDARPPERAIFARALSIAQLVLGWLVP